MVDNGSPVPTAIRLAPDVEAWLKGGAGTAVACERVIETSISWIFLCGDHAYKLKKPVDLGFLNFTTPDRRRWACDRELAFNRATAPDIYQDVLPITRDHQGGLRFGGSGPAVEWALKMRRFDETATLANRLPALDGDFAERLGRKIARYHLDAAPGASGGGSAGLRYVLDSNAQLLRQEATDLGPERVERVIAATGAAFGTVAPRLDARLAAGFVRCCHGDLHLGNILLEDGEPILFDCIEFNDNLREIDVLYDIAFLLMDLGFRGAHEAANRVMNGWFDEAARGFGDALWAGLEVLPLYAAVRATVRAHVNALEARPDISVRYLQAAESYLQPCRPTLFAVGGFSGAGKTTLARKLAPRLGPLPGAIVLRSDEIRKRLWGVNPTERLPPEAYSRDRGARVYAELQRIADVCLRAGRSVVTDAVFLRPQEREAIERVALLADARFEAVWLETSADVLRARVQSRTGDASDADATVLARQLAQNPGDIAWRREGGGDLASAAEAIQRRLARSMSGGPR